MLTPAFHFQILDGFFDVFNRNAVIFTEQIEKKLQSNTEVDVYSMAGRCTLDVICGTGHDYVIETVIDVYYRSGNGHRD